MPAKSSGERVKEYRQRLKVSNSVKYFHMCQKDKIRKQKSRALLKLPENRERYELFKEKDRIRKQKRVAEEQAIEHGSDEITGKGSTAASLAKSVYKVARNMPRRKSSKVTVVSKIIKSMTPGSKRTLMKRANLGSGYDNSHREINAVERDEMILAFLEEPDISYVCPGRKDTVYLGKDDQGMKIFREKHYLRWTIDEAVSMYNIGKEEDDQVSRYRIHKVASKNKHIKFAAEKPDDDCRCEQCENVDLILDSIHNVLKRENERELSKLFPTDGIRLARTLVCDVYNKKCTIPTAKGGCVLCEGLEQKYKDTFEFLAKIPEVRLRQWKRIDNKMRKVETVESGEDVVNLFKDKVDNNEYLVHVYNIFRQFRELRALKCNIESNEAIVMVDFARNYDNKQASEIQSAYFGHDTFTLYTVYCYEKGPDGELEPYSMAIVSNESNHDRNVSFTTNQIIIDNLRERNPELKSVYFWSDGCARQFRSKFVFKSLMLYPKNIQLSWDYGEVSHFKGPHDGIGGTIKRSVYQAVQQNKVVINSAKEFAQAASKYTQIKVLYVDKTQIKYPELDDARPVHGTLKIHHVKRDGGKLVFKKNSPYYCEDEPEFKILDYSSVSANIREDLPSNVGSETNTVQVDVPESILELHEGSFYKVQHLNERGVESRFAKLESFTDDGGYFTFAYLKCTRAGRSYYELDRFENCVKLENILSVLPEPEVTRRGLNYWD